MSGLSMNIDQSVINLVGKYISMGIEDKDTIETMLKSDVSLLHGMMYIYVISIL